MALMMICQWSQHETFFHISCIVLRFNWVRSQSLSHAGNVLVLKKFSLLSGLFTFWCGDTGLARMSSCGDRRAADVSSYVQRESVCGLKSRHSSQFYWCTVYNSAIMLQSVYNLTKRRVVMWHRTPFLYSLTKRCVMWLIQWIDCL
jgi:hypothetical protein